MVKTKQQPKEEIEQVDSKHNELLANWISEQVLASVGTPPNFSHIKAINVFGDRWRVNVYDKSPGFIEKKRIVVSFFCIVDEQGNITSPQISKKFT